MKPFEINLSLNTSNVKSQLAQLQSEAKIEVQADLKEKGQGLVEAIEKLKALSDLASGKNVADKDIYSLLLGSYKKLKAEMGKGGLDGGEIENYQKQIALLVDRLLDSHEELKKLGLDKIDFSKLLPESKEFSEVSKYIAEMQKSSAGLFKEMESHSIGDIFDEAAIEKQFKQMQSLAKEFADKFGIKVKLDFDLSEFLGNKVKTQGGTGNGNGVEVDIVPVISDPAKFKSDVERQLKEKGISVDVDVNPKIADENAFKKELEALMQVSNAVEGLTQALSAEGADSFQKISEALKIISDVKLDQVGFSNLSNFLKSVKGDADGSIDQLKNNIEAIAQALDKYQGKIVGSGSFEGIGELKAALSGFPTPKQATNFATAAQSAAIGIDDLLSVLSNPNLANGASGGLQNMLSAIDSLLNRAQELNDLATILKNSSRVVNAAQAELYKQKDVDVSDAIRELKDVDNRVANTIKQQTSSTGSYSLGSLSTELDNARDKVIKLRQDSTLTAAQLKKLGDALQSSQDNYQKSVNSAAQTNKKQLEEIAKGLNNDSYTKAVDKLQAKFEAFTTTSDEAKKRVEALRKEITAMATSASDADRIKALFAYRAEYEKASKELGGLQNKYDSDSAFRAQIDHAREAKKAVEEVDNALLSWQRHGLDTSYSSKYSDYVDQFNKIKNAILQSNGATQQQIESLRTLGTEISRLEKYQKGGTILGSSSDEGTATGMINSLLSANGRTVKSVNFGEVDSEGIKKWSAQVREADNTVKNFSGTWDSVTGSIAYKTEVVGTELTGLAGIFDSIKKKTKELLLYWTATTFNPYRLFSAVKQGLQIVHEYDDALVEMRKVSDESITALKDFQEESFEIAKAVGSTGLNIQKSTADWLRLGKSFTEAKQLAQDTAVLFNVSEFENIDDATSSLVAMTQAYKELSAIDIINVLNNIGG